MPKPPSEHKPTHNVQALRWPNPVEREQVRLAAAREGMPVSAYIRRAAVRQSARDLRKAA